MPASFPPRYCRFDDDAREFIIEKPDTPRPWENRLWNNLLSVQITNHGSARVTERDLAERFYRYNESGARAVYLMDRDSCDLWSAGWLPVRTPLDFYEARHGINYTVITGVRGGVSVKWINTVHSTEACELWRITVANRTDRQKRLILVPFYQVGLSFRDPYFHGSPDLFRAEWNSDRTLFFVKNHSRQRDGERYALAWKSSIPADGFELSTEGFLRWYGSMERPQVILRDDFQNSLPDRLPPVFAMRHGVDLDPGCSADLSIQLFGGEDFGEVKRRAPVLGRKGVTSASLALHREAAVRYFSENNVHTGDTVLDRYVNLWTKHQLRYNVFWNREEFGIGFRDAMQDCDSFVQHDPEFCRSRLLEATRHIYPDGHTVRKWARLDLKPYFDGGIWYVNTLCKYVRETGDLDLLTVVEPYFDDGSSATVLDHARRAMDFLDLNRGPGGLCRMGFGDWNDALNGIDREGKGQSVWTSMAFVWALCQFADLLGHLGEADADHYRQLAQGMRRILNDTCFEEDRYIRAINDAGERVGSESCDEGKVYLNPQSWAMISGIASDEQAAVILDTVQRHLYTDYGPVLLDPVYTRNRPDIGRITSDPPGFVENGANYVHAAMFHAYGLVLAGFPDQALEVLHRVFPSNPLNPSDKSGLEPYMITNAYEGPASTHPGRAMFPWRTGSASWLLKVVWDGFFGIIPYHEGLRIHPRLPLKWQVPVSANRRVRGKHIQFVFASRDNRSRGQETASLTVTPGALIPYGDLVSGMTILVRIGG